MMYKLFIKWVIMTIFVVSMAAGLHAQSAFFAEKAGMEMTYVNNDAKGKATGYQVMTVRDVKGSGSNMTIEYSMELLDKNRKPPKNSPGAQNFEVVVKDGVLILDLNQMIPAQLVKDMGTQIKFTGLPMELPNDLQPGQQIKDADVTMEVDMGIMKMSTVIKMTDGMCLDIEDAAVPAGTFKSHKISQTVSATILRMNTVSKTLRWYTPGVGVVKTETYDSKGKLTASTVLVDLKGN